MVRKSVARLDLPHLADVARQLLLAAPIRLWALILAGPPLTAFDAWLVWIIWRGGWPEALAGQQLEILGGLAFGHVVLVGVIVVSLAAVKVEAETKLGRLMIDGDGQPDPPPPPAAPAPPANLA